MNVKCIKMISLFIFFSLFLSACGKMSNLPQGEFVNSYESPDSNFTINIYLCNGGATTDFAIRGELVDNHNTTKKIFIGVITRKKPMLIGLTKIQLL